MSYNYWYFKITPFFNKALHAIVITFTLTIYLSPTQLAAHCAKLKVRSHCIRIKITEPRPGASYKGRGTPISIIYLCVIIERTLYVLMLIAFETQLTHNSLLYLVQLRWNLTFNRTIASQCLSMCIVQSLTTIAIHTPQQR